MLRKAKVPWGGVSLVCATVAVFAYGPWDRPSMASELQGARRSIDVLFSPGGGCTDRIVEEIANAEERVLVQAFIFTSRPISDALIEARRRGVECIVIADKSQETRTYARLPVLKRDGVTVRIDHEHATANNKVILIDRSTILTGSMNYTRAAEEKNAENLLIIKGYRRLFDKYLANFERHQAHTRPYKKL